MPDRISDPRRLSLHVRQISHRKDPEAEVPSLQYALYIASTSENPFQKFPILVIYDRAYEKSSVKILSFPELLKKIYKSASYFFLFNQKIADAFGRKYFFIVHFYFTQVSLCCGFFPTANRLFFFG